MMSDQALKIARPESAVIPACELSGCESIAEMRRSLEALQRTNQKLRIALVELECMASTDKLTGAWNRRRLEEAVRNEMDRLKRYDHPLSLLVLDIDLFKQVNDGYGHGAGDRLLVELAERIRSVLRATDSITRWGGEEFVVLCPNSALAATAKFADRLRLSIADARFSVGKQITASVGVAECLPGETWEQWFHRADTALYRAKSLGRNQVQIAPEEPPRAAGTGPGNFVRLLWHSAYACGNEVVDREHRALFIAANALLAAILSGRPADETNAALATLIDDVVQHFRDEEEILAAAGYPGAANHATVHRDLVDRAAALVERFRTGKADVGELFQFLAHEVVARHILGADRDFFPYLESTREMAVC
jgi:diguanylate cyclase (GGDEF)-like protein/hemerythrin-like metal-binding protein